MSLSTVLAFLYLNKMYSLWLSILEIHFDTQANGAKYESGKRGMVRTISSF
jgi:hypothetical protein